MINTKDILDQLNKAFLKGEKIIEFDNFLSSGKRKKQQRIYLNVHTNKRDLFIKYSPNAKPDLFKVEYNALTNIASYGFLVPQPVKLIEKGIIMSAVVGMPLEEIIKRNGLSKSLALLNRAVSHIAIFHEKYNCKLEKSDKKKIYSKITGKKVNAKIEALINQANFGFTHGDLDPFNTIYDVRKSKLGLIDWEDFRERGIQELDILHFVIMLGVITNPEVPYEQLYKIIFEKYEKNPYLDLLERYCRERSVSLELILQLIPVYCDGQNYRLIKVKRKTKDFLYHDFKKIYYETQKSI